MEAYSCFAQVYDLFMDNVPYKEWGERIKEILTSYGIRDGILLELGCGTGKLTRELAAFGYDMIGLDHSIEMLGIAREQEDMAAGGARKEILYLFQDMREFELYGTVRAIYSACDSMNYLLTEEELLQVFRLVNNYLDPGGVFLFDMNTPYQYAEVLKDGTFAENREEGSFIWENAYDPDSGINEYELTLFIKEETHFCRFQETHYQRSYTPQTIRRLLEEAGLEFIACYDGYTSKPLQPDSGRMLIVAREREKKGE